MYCKLTGKMTSVFHRRRLEKQKLRIANRWTDLIKEPINHRMDKMTDRTDVLKFLLYRSCKSNHFTTAGNS